MKFDKEKTSDIITKKINLDALTVANLVAEYLAKGGIVIFKQEIQSIKLNNGI